MATRSAAGKIGRNRRTRPAGARARKQVPEQPLRLGEVIEHLGLDLAARRLSSSRRSSSGTWIVHSNQADPPETALDEAYSIRGVPSVRSGRFAVLACRYRGRVFEEFDFGVLIRNARVPENEANDSKRSADIY